MGRFYCGDIEGKFSFAVQDSDDIENLLSVVGNTIIVGMFVIV